MEHYLPSKRNVQDRKVNFNLVTDRMYMDRQTITKDQECTWTDTFTGKECTGTDRSLQRIINHHEVNFNLLTDTQTDRHSDIWTSRAASSQLKS